jgi:hypothetical protein
MPLPGKRWRHVVIGTHNSWLPGDPRGFRSRHHKLHSSGDYKNPPRPGEHAGLHEYSKRISGEPVIIPRDLRGVVGGAILAKLEKLGHRVLALSVAGMHTHLLVELPELIRAAKHVVGQCKAASSHSVRHPMPGQVWSGGGKFKPVDDPDYQREVFRYILDQEYAWVWSYRDEQRKHNP